MQKQIEIEKIYNIFKKYGNLNIKVKTPFGFFKINNCDITAKNEPVVEIITSNNKKLKCSINHKLKTKNGRFVPISNIHPGKTNITTEEGCESIKTISYTGLKEDLYDIEVDKVKQYYSNGIVSHNSNFIDTLLYVLFNKSSRMSKITKIINNNQKECSANILIEINGEMYRISRFSKRGTTDSTSTKVIFEKNIDGRWESETGTSRTDTDKNIRKLIGTFDDIIISNISPQFKISYFLDSGLEETFRLELLNRFLGLNIFKLQYDETHKQINEFEILLKQFKTIDYASHIFEYKKEIEKLNESLADLEDDKIYFNNCSDNAKMQIVALKTMIQDVINENKIVDYDCEKMKNLLDQINEQKNTEQKLYNDDLKRFKTLLDIDFESQIINIKEQIKKRDIIQNDLTKIESKILVSSSELEKDRTKINILEQQSWIDSNELCQSCEFFKDADSFRKHLNKAEELILNFNKEKNNLTNKIIKLSLLDKELETMQNQLDDKKRLQSSVQIRKLNIEKFELQIEKIKRIIDEQNKEIQKIELIHQIKETNKYANKLVVEKEKELEIIIKQSNSIEYNIIAHNKRIAELENNTNLAKDNIQKMHILEEKFNDYKLYLKCVHREGIPYTIISSYIDIINDEIHKIIGDYIPFEIQFSIDSDRKSILINIIYENGTSNPIELGSGMEKTVAAIAIRAAFASISNIPKCNLFIIDEPFVSLDKDWISSIDKFLIHLKTMFEHVILISHISDVQDFVDQTLTIDTNSGYSKINFK